MSVLDYNATDTNDEFRFYQTPVDDTPVETPDWNYADDMGQQFDWGGEVWGITGQEDQYPGYVAMEEAGDPFSTGWGGYDAPYYADEGDFSYELEDEGSDWGWLKAGLKGIDWNKWLGLGAGLLGQHFASKAKPMPRPRGGGGGGGSKRKPYKVGRAKAQKATFTGKDKPKPSLMK